MEYTDASRINVDDEVSIPAPREYVDDRDSDSVSVATSATSVNAKLRAARLRAEFMSLKAKHDIEREEQKLKQRKEQLELETKMNIAAAEAEVYVQHAPVSAESGLNPEAPEWQHMAHLTPARQSEPPAPTPQSVPLAPSSSEGQGELSRQLIAAVSMPHAQLMSFDGSPLEYWTFIRAFENSVERVCEDSVSRLTRLLQYCTGKAKRVIQCCAVMEPNEGYKRAHELLRERFGNSYVIAEAWLERVSDGRVIEAQDGEALQEFADDLRNCQQTLEAMGHLSEINTQRVLAKIVRRLPLYLQNRWIREVRVIRVKKCHVAQIQDLVSFVAGASEEVNDPVYRRPRDAGKPKEKGTLRHYKGQNFHAVTEPERPALKAVSCVMCGADHSIFQCTKFKESSPEARYKFARDHRLCFNCLRAGHVSKTCKLARTCSVPGCSEKHTRFLHQAIRTGAVRNGARDVVREATSSSQNNTHLTEVSSGFVNAEDRCMVTGAGSTKTALPIVPVKVRSPDGQYCVSTYALLDNGSTTTFCTRALAQSLRLDGRQETLTLSTLRGSGGVETSVVSMTVSDVNDENVVQLRTVYTREELPISVANAADRAEVKRWRHLEGIKTYNTVNGNVDLLIGQDSPEALMPLEVRSCNESLAAPFAVRTVLGWTIQGPVKKPGGQVAFVNFVRNDAELHQKLEKFWKLDFGEELASDAKGMSVEDRRAVSVMQETINKVDGHYELAIPFKHRPVNLPNNRAQAEGRLCNLGKRLGHNAELNQKYCDGMTDMLTKGYASRVEKEQVEKDDGKTWYLPHHPVAKKGGKIRIVFDCAARYRGTSLNDNVMQGPDLTNKLVGVLSRFRQEPVAVMADVEAMFNQVRVVEKDRDVLRYLWWPNGNQALEPETYRMNVHLFGGTWSPSCCNFALRQVASDNEDCYDPDIVSSVTRNFYVDDCLKSVESDEKAVELVKDLTDLLKQGGFKLTKWVSTSRIVIESVPESDRSQRVSIDMCEEGCLPTEKALGLLWNVQDDCFMFRMSQKKAPQTRRGLLSTVCSIYDPLGFISPLTLVAKRLMQDLTRKKLGWDEPLPEMELNEWARWSDDLVKIESVRVQRCVKSGALNDVCYQLHHFADASCTAYGVVTYLRAEEPSGKATCSLLMAKSRLAPVKTVTLPRLELMAATLAVKVDQLMQGELDIPLVKSVFWTDSTIVLQYISNEYKRFHTFVANRVAAIRNSSSPEQWRHVSSEENVADDVSRGLTADELIRNQRWWNGPQFLTKPEGKWPNQHTLREIASDDPEVKREKLAAESYAVVGELSGQPTGVDVLLGRRSSWSKLKVDVAWILRFVAYLRSKLHPSMPVESGPLTVTELCAAETAIIRYIQKRNFPQEMEMLHADNRHSANRTKKGSALHKLNPLMMPNGTICVGGRLKHAPLISDEAKHPVILPKAHHVVDLIIRHEHETNAHVGKEHVLSLLRQKYWPISGRSAVRRVLSRCVTCRRIAARRGEQQMADLPPDRVTAEKPPFTFVGVDLFGPFMVKRGRSVVKRYGCLFTCLVVRAVHIEVVCSLESDSFLNALQRFISRRGKPVQIRSDNATNFRAGDQELRQALKQWNSAHVAGYLQQREIEWKYNPPGASHMGGVWERQIRTVRKVLSSLLKEQVLDDESLNTVMCQAEYIVNSRPLTAVSDDASDLEALTPNHLLTLRHEPVLPPGIFVSQDNYSRRRWRQVQYMADIFWKRWTREYLPLLQRRTRWVNKTRDFRSGDVVLLVDDSPRNCWPLARILSVHRSDDGHVRSVTLKTRDTSSVVRPISKICLLESTAEDLN